MKWYQGKIPDAIQKSKQNKVVFIVYVHGQDDLSNKMTEMWESTEISEVCDNAGCVAIKLAGNSAECGHFSQIYPVLVVPSTYFIGINGVPIEVTPGGIDKEAFLTTLKNVIKVHEEQVKSAPSPSSQSENLDSGQSSMVSQSHMTEEPGASAAPLQDRVQRAKDLMQQKKADKEKAEEEQEKVKEKERRKLGQDLQKLKQYQSEREVKETVEQLRKDRAEEKRQRELIKEQIARDREERAARFKKEKEDQEKRKEEQKKVKQLAEQQATAAAEAKKSENARIQVRLPDGSSITNTFPSSQNLSAVYQIVCQHMGQQVSLSQVFPKRVFTEEDMDKSLISLDLAPSAALIALPGNKSVKPANQGDSGGGIMGLILAPFLFLWNILYSLLFGGASQASSSTTPDNTQSQSSEQRNTDARPKSAYQRRPLSRPDGNMRRLTDYRDDDDENATWNGNSTQQM